MIDAFDIGKGREGFKRLNDPSQRIFTGAVGANLVFALILVFAISIGAIQRNRANTRFTPTMV